ncbi:hypothetical protein LCGC14_2891190, partial [marine sediment metagenome]
LGTGTMVPARTAPVVFVGFNSVFAIVFGLFVVTKVFSVFAIAAERRAAAAAALQGRRAELLELLELLDRRYGEAPYRGALSLGVPRVRLRGRGRGASGAPFRAAHHTRHVARGALATSTGASRWLSGSGSGSDPSASASACMAPSRSVSVM